MELGNLNVGITLSANEENLPKDKAEASSCRKNTEIFVRALTKPSGKSNGVATGNCASRQIRIRRALPTRL